MSWNEDAAVPGTASYGRYPDGTGPVAIITPPTPGTSNDAAQIDISTDVGQIKNGMPTWSIVSDPPPEYLNTETAEAMNGRSMHYITTGAGSKTGQVVLGWKHSNTFA